MKKRYTTKVYIQESSYFYGALLLLLSVFFSYVYFVSEAVAYVVMRKEVDTQISSMGTTISMLESEYIELQHTVSSEIASQHGFVAAEKKVFIDTSADTLVFSGN